MNEIQQFYHTECDGIYVIAYINRCANYMAQ